VPCGIEEFGVTSLARLGRKVDFDTWDRALIARADAFLAALERPCPPQDRQTETSE
jgi:lipoyl(octanoyl) transferase